MLGGILFIHQKGNILGSNYARYLHIKHLKNFAKIFEERTIWIELKTHHAKVLQWLIVLQWHVDNCSVKHSLSTNKPSHFLILYVTALRTKSPTPIMNIFIHRTLRAPRCSCLSGAWAWSDTFAISWKEEKGAPPFFWINVNFKCCKKSMECFVHNSNICLGQNYGLCLVLSWALCNLLWKLCSVHQYVVRRKGGIHFENLDRCLGW